MKLKSKIMMICFGKADQTLIDKLGGLGSQLELFCTHIGEISEKCLALRVRIDEKLSHLDDFKLINREKHKAIHNYIKSGDITGRGGEEIVPLIPIYVSKKSTSKICNSITVWSELSEPIILSGELQYRTTIGVLRETILVDKKDVSIGSLVRKHFPALKGKEIGMVCKFVERWMEKTFMVNLASNEAMIEFHIQQLDVVEILKDVDLLSPKLGGATSKSALTDSLS
jgi:hypothetical protein